MVEKGGEKGVRKGLRRTAKEVERRRKRRRMESSTSTTAERDWSRRTPRRRRNLRFFREFQTSRRRAADRSPAAPTTALPALLAENGFCFMDSSSSDSDAENENAHPRQRRRRRRRRGVGGTMGREQWERKDAAPHLPGNIWTANRSLGKGKLGRRTAAGTKSSTAVTRTETTGRIRVFDTGRRLRRGRTRRYLERVGGTGWCAGFNLLVWAIRMHAWFFFAGIRGFLGVARVHAGLVAREGGSWSR